MAAPYLERALKVGDLASLAGVSAQTIRVWEKQGLLQSSRTSGGQRLFSHADGERAMRIAALRRRHGWNSAAIRSALADTAAADPPPAPDEQLYGPRIRAARHARGLTLEQAAAGAGVSRSTLSAIELGQSAVTPHLLSSIADALGMTMNAFVSRAGGESRVVRRDERAVTRMAGGVRWEELAPAGGALEPALLVVPAGASSGGDYARPGEVWVCVLEGELTLRVDGQPESVGTGEAILLAADSTWSWHNASADDVRAIYVEQASLQHR